MKEESKYKMDRTASSASSFKDVDDHVTYWEDKIPMERLQAACFIINNLYGVTSKTRVRKDIITARKRN